jgi:ribosome biogenesis GTPase A
MLPFIILGVAGATAYAAYKKYASGHNSSVPSAISVGKFAIWGLPNSGKSTFISQLLRKPHAHGHKEATTAKTVYSTIPLVQIGTRQFRIESIVDMPGTRDRLADWLELVNSHQHVFYLINLARKNDREYMAGVRYDLSKTVDALKTSTKTLKRLNIIASHVDESFLNDISIAEVNNHLQEDNDFQRVFESIDGVAGYVYTANLTDKDSFKRLLESILKDYGV